MLLTNCSLKFWLDSSFNLSFLRNDHLTTLLKEYESLDYDAYDTANTQQQARKLLERVLIFILIFVCVILIS